MSKIEYGTETEIDELINQGQLEDALVLIKGVIEEVFDDVSAVARIFGSKALDEKCLAVGKKLWGAHKNQPDGRSAQNSFVIVASHLDKYGGHSKVVEDLLNGKKEATWHLLLTDMYGQLDRDYLTERFDGLAQIHCTTGTGLREKTEWLVERLVEINPQKIFLFNHHQDVSAIASIEPYLRIPGVVNYYHHADHQLALGLHLPGAIHIDPHCLGYFNCRDNEHIKDNQYLPLVVPDKRSWRKSSDFLASSRLITCSSGTYGKFSAPYKYQYFDVILRMLAESNATHIHIGNIPEADLKRFNEQLDRFGIVHDRFVAIPWVESLWDALLQLKVDLYLGSFPIGGGRALIEAMGAGIPCLMHANLISRFYSGLDLAYEEAFIWNNPAELCGVVNNLSADLLRNHSSRAREFYERYYSPAVFSVGLDNLLSQNKTLLTPPPQKDFYSDGLYQYIKSASQFNKINAFWDQKIQQLNRENLTLKQRFNAAYAELNARSLMPADRSAKERIRELYRLAKKCIRGRTK